MSALFSTVWEGVSGWAWEWLVYLGLAQKEATIVLVGLDNAGKTTLLNRLKTGKVRSFTPTQRPQLEEVTVGGLSLKAWDLGGHEPVRAMWDEYLADTDGIVFLVDSCDSERFEEAKYELQRLLAFEDLADTPVLILGTKADLLQLSASGPVLVAALGLDQPSSRRAQVHLARCSLVLPDFDSTGLKAAFEWLSSQI